MNGSASLLGLGWLGLLLGLASAASGGDAWERLAMLRRDLAAAGPTELVAEDLAGEGRAGRLVLAPPGCALLDLGAGGSVLAHDGTVWAWQPGRESGRRGPAAELALGLALLTTPLDGLRARFDARALPARPGTEAIEIVPRDGGEAPSAALVVERAGARLLALRWTAPGGQESDLALSGYRGAERPACEPPAGVCFE